MGILHDMINISGLDQQYGLNPQLILTIDWDGTTVKYAKDEASGVYGYVKSFSNLAFVGHTDGMGEVSSLNVVMFDAFGHFKSMMETNPVYSKLVTATVSMNGNDLFTGRIEQCQWSQDQKEFSFDVISELVENKLGYTPKIADVDEADPLRAFFVANLNEQGWPKVYGIVHGLET
jgi:hypothetical protein